MISSEAFRAVIGCWNATWVHFKPLKRCSSKKSGLSEKDPEDKLKDALVLQFYKNFILLFLGFVVLPYLLLYSSHHLIVNRPEPQLNKNLWRERTVILTKQLIQKLLIMAGIESNPGPRSRQSVACPHCGVVISRTWNLKKHIERWHEKGHNIVCRFCSKSFEDFDEWKSHMMEHKPRTDRWQETANAFNGRDVELTHLYHETNAERALGEDMLRSVITQIGFYRRFFGALRFQLNFVCLMEKSFNDENRREQFYFQGTRGRDLIRGEFEMKKAVEEEFVRLRERILDLDVDTEGSGWSFVCSEAMMIQITKHESKKMGSFIPFRPRNVRGNIKKIAQSNMINVKNTDDKCVIWNIILSVFGDKIKKDKTNPKNLKKYLPLINDEDVEYPITEKDLQFLEDNNRKLNISINVFKYISSTHIEPFYISRLNRKGIIRCNMLLIQNKKDDSSDEMQHLVHIKDMRRLFRGMKQTNQETKHFYCPSCQHFKTQSSKRMIAHFKQCRNPKYFKKILPPSESAFLPDGTIIKSPNSYKAESPILRG